MDFMLLHESEMDLETNNRTASFGSSNVQNENERLLNDETLVALAELVDVLQDVYQDMLKSGYDIVNGEIVKKYEIAKLHK